MKLLSKLMTWVLTLGVLAGASTLEFGPFAESGPQSLSDAQYKDYIINLKCPEIRKSYYDFVKVPEVGGALYEPSLSPPPLQQGMPPLLFPPPLLPVLPNLPPPATLPSPAEQVTTLEPTTLVPSNSSKSYSDPYSEYDEDIVTRSKREDTDAGQTTTSVPIAEDNVTLPGYLGNDTTNYTEECTAPLTREWGNYNWYQVLLDNGGPPAEYLRKGLKLNLTKVWDPCERPVYPVQPLEERTSFGFTHTKFEKVHRSEQAEIMLAGTPHEFVDVKGELVWAPPNSTRRYFHLTYHKDDTGLYFQINYQQKCVFYEGSARVDCQWTTSICDCVNGKEHCTAIPPLPIAPAAGIPSGLQAALVGGG